MVKIQSLEGLDFDTLYQTFQEAFIDYSIRFEKNDLRRILDRRGYVASVSFGAFTEQEKLVAFTFNCFGTVEGIKSAYDTGTGTIPSFRGQGLAVSIFLRSFTELQQRGIDQYILDVLQDNKKAISVYKKVGLEITREFQLFQHLRTGVTPLKPLSSSYQVKSIDIDEVLSIDWEQYFLPAWQNSLECISRVKSEFIVYGGFDLDRNLIAYCIFHPVTGDIPQLFVMESHRRQGLGSAFIRAIIDNSNVENLKMLIPDINNESIILFAQSIQLQPSMKMFEMKRDLRRSIN